MLRAATSINPELPTWGNMLRDGQRLVTTA